MGTIQVTGDSPFELFVQQDPTVRAEGGDVVLTIEAGGIPFRVIFSLKQSQSVAGQLPSAMKMVQVNQQQ